MSELKLPEQSMSPKCCFSFDKLDTLINSATFTTNVDNNVGNFLNNDFHEEIVTNGIGNSSTGHIANELDVYGQKGRELTNHDCSKKKHSTDFLYLIWDIIRHFFDNRNN